MVQEIIMSSKYYQDEDAGPGNIARFPPPQRIK